MSGPNSLWAQRIADQEWLTKLKPVLQRLADAEASLAARWAASAHRRLYRVEWGLRPRPDHFEHRIDLFFGWAHSRNPTWLERGILGGLALRGKDLLELSCGDGFNAYHFYSGKSRRVVACDRNEQALAFARRRHAAPNITYVAADVRHSLPPGEFANVIWDFGWPFEEYFSLDELAGVIRRVSALLTEEGVFSGHTQAGSRIASTADLAALLKPCFTNVVVLETRALERRNLYFWAGATLLPFMADWPQVVVLSDPDVVPIERSVTR